MRGGWILLFITLILLLLTKVVREKIKFDPLFSSIYYINLDRRPEKQKNIESQIKPLQKFTRNIIRWSAIDGEGIDPRARTNSVSGDAVTILTVQGREDLNNPTKTFGLSLTKGAVGCAMSHKTIWEEVVKTKADLVLILEDDAVILPNFARKISAIISELPEEWDILYLGSGQHTIEKRISPHLAQPSRIYGLFGYVLNWRGAQRLLAQCFPLRYQIDTELWLHFNSLKPLMAVPFVVGEKKGKSDIQIHRLRRTRAAALRRVSE